MYHKILVAVDGSPCSDKSLSSAISLAAQFASHLSLVHVIDNPLYMQMFGIYNNYALDIGEESFAEGLKESGTKLLEYAERMALEKLPREQVTTNLTFGHPADRICEVAVEENADLIIIGSQGMRSLERILLGSVASSVVYKSKVSVLIAR
ncbi:MAG: universal stress protein [Clostridia bacterium]